MEVLAAVAVVVVVLLLPNDSGSDRPSSERRRKPLLLLIRSGCWLMMTVRRTVDGRSCTADFLFGFLRKEKEKWSKFKVNV